MSKIIYLTNAMHFNDFEKMIKYVEVMPNPSNQNFHYRFITSLTEHYKVKVISQRPLNHKNCKLPAVLDEFHHNFYYPGFHLKPIIRNLELYKNSKEILRSLKISKDDYVFVDLLNINLVHLAKHVKKHYKTKVIGILTDNPHNLSASKSSYISDVEKAFDLCDGFVFLTEDLNKYANKNLKPAAIIPGVLSYTKIKSDIDGKFGKYIYFAGALYERYGVKNLVDAFVKIKTDWHLLIAGHGPLKDELAFLGENHPRIDFLGAISPYKSLMYVYDAMALVNPRPFDQNLDKFSIPSKVIEYANSARPVISTSHSDLVKIYQDNILWADDSVDGLEKALVSVINNYDKHSEKAKIAKEIGEQYFGKKTFSAKIETLIKSLIS